MNYLYNQMSKKVLNTTAITKTMSKFVPSIGKIRLLPLFSWTSSLIGGLFLICTLFLVTIFLFPRLLDLILRILPFLSPSTKRNLFCYWMAFRNNLLSTNIFRRKNYICSDYTSIPHPRYYPNKTVDKVKLSNMLHRLKAWRIDYTRIEKRVAQGENICLEIPYELGIVQTMGPDEIFNLHLMRDLHQRFKSYSFPIEAFFGDMIVNGSNPYSLQRMTLLSENQTSPESKYQKALFETLKRGPPNRSLLNKFDFGFRLQDLRERVKNNAEIYCMNLSQLRDIHVRQPYDYEVDQQVNSETKQSKLYLHFPYAVFVRGMDMETGRYGWICIAAVFRYTTNPQRFVTFSPFLSGQQDIWKYVRSHIAKAHFLDFEVRTHLGIFHFGASLYSVPIYNFKNSCHKRDYSNNYNTFLKYMYQPFIKGYQGANYTALLTLTNPTYPSTHLGTSSRKVLDIIRNYSYAVDFNTFNPNEFVQERGLGELDVQGNVVYYDKVYYNILSELVSGVYEELKIGNFSHELLKEINDTMNEQLNPPRPQITDLRVLFTNLIWTFTVYHWHCSVNNSISLYFKLRPMALCQPIPSSLSQCSALSENSFFPSVDFSTDSINMFRAATFKDPDNFMMDVLSRLSFEANREKLLGISDLFDNAVRNFQNVMLEIISINKEREHDQLPKLHWLNPSKMQASINV